MNDDEEDCNIVINDDDIGSDDEPPSSGLESQDDSTPRDDEVDNMSIENEVTPGRAAHTDNVSRAYSELDQNAMLLTEEVVDDPLVEITPIKNMAAVGRIGMSSMGSVYSL